MTRVQKSLSLTNQHDDLLKKIAKESNITVSEALRKCLDSVLAHNSTLGLPIYRDEEKSLQARLSAVQETIKKLESEQQTQPSAENAFSFAPGPDVKVVKQYKDNRQVRTEEERFLNAAIYVASGDKAITPEVRKRVLLQANIHPNWFAKIPEPERKRLETMLRSAGNQATGRD